MNVISIISLKSMGKSTSCQVLADYLLTNDVAVHLITLDPQGSNDIYVQEASKLFSKLTWSAWQEFEKSTKPIDLLFEIIDERDDLPGTIIIDVQGTDNDLIQHAASNSDLILVPLIDADMERMRIQTTFEKLLQVDRVIKRQRGIDAKTNPLPVLNIRTYYTRVTLGVSKKGMEVLEVGEQHGLRFLGCNLMENGCFSKICVNGFIKDENETNAKLMAKQTKAKEIAATWAEAIGRALP